MHLSLYLLSILCGVAYVVTIALGDRWPIFAVTCFGLMIVAVVTDRSLGEEGVRSARRR